MNEINKINKKDATSATSTSATSTCAIKKIHLVYFSPSGSSEKVIKKIASSITELHPDIPVEKHDLLTPASRKQEYNFAPDDLVFFCTMTASLVLTMFDEIFGCLNGNGAPFVGVATFSNSQYMKVILLQEIKSYAEKRGFKVAAMGAFPTAHSLAASLGGEGRPNADDEKLIAEFGQKVYEKVANASSVSGGDYVMHDEIKVDDADAEKVSAYRSVESGGHQVFPFRAKVISDACIKCKTCVRHCPVDAIDIESKTFDLDKCIGCWSCINRCPKKAISPADPEVDGLVKKFSGAVKVPFEVEMMF